MLKKILIVILLALVALQFFRPAKNLSAAPSPHDVIALHTPPADVKAVLENACYDCHSNNTRYPWYAEIQPFGWFLAQHVRDGKHHLNFSEFGRLTPKRAKTRLEDSIDEITERHMPLDSYTWIHRNARLTDAQIAAFTSWAEATIERLDDPKTPAAAPHRD